MEKICIAISGTVKMAQDLYRFNAIHGIFIKLEAIILNLVRDHKTSQIAKQS